MSKEYIFLNPKQAKINETYKNGVKYQFMLENSMKNAFARTASTSRIYEKSSDEGYDSPNSKLSFNLNESRLSIIDKRNLSNSSEPKSKPPARLPSIKFDNIEPLKPAEHKSDSILKFKSDLYLNAKKTSRSYLRKSIRSSTDLGSEIDCGSIADDDDDDDEVFINTKDIIKIEKKSKQLSPVRTRRTILSESELKALNISDKFMKDAKNMIFLPETNSFCPRNTFYYLSASNNKK